MKIDNSVTALLLGVENKKKFIEDNQDFLQIFISSGIPYFISSDFANIIHSNIERENFIFDFLDKELKGLSKRDRAFLFDKLKKEFEVS